MRNIMRLAGGVFLLATVFGASATSFGATLIIDTFDDAVASWPQTSATIGSGIVENVAVLGGVRDTLITQAVLDESFDSVQVGVFPVAGLFDYASSVGADGRTVLAYDGDGSMSADLIDTPVIAVELQLFDYANNLPLDVDVTLRSGDDVETLSAAVNAPVTGSPATLVFNFSPFAGTLDFGNINEIVVDFDPGRGGDFRVQEIRAIPEPVTSVLLIIGGAFVLRRRPE